MSATTITVLSSGTITLFLIVLFRIERERGRRFGESYRSIIDRMFTGIGNGFRTRFPEINSGFFQELVHYVMHVFLSKALGMLRALEAVTLYIVRFNRMHALRLRKRVRGVEQEKQLEATPSDHLQAIAEHKRSVELTDVQKEKRKNAALEGTTKF